MRDETRAVRDVLDGDPEAFRPLVLRYQKPVYNLMLRFTGSPEEAADLTQEAFTRAYARLGSFRQDRRFFPWLYAIGLNIARDQYRRRGREETMEHLPEPEADTDQQELMVENLDARRVFECVEQLPEHYREALVLRFREDFSMVEIAETLDVSVSGAKMRVSRGLAMLRKRIGEDGYDR